MLQDAGSLSVRRADVVAVDVHASGGCHAFGVTAGRWRIVQLDAGSFHAFGMSVG
tara:strand:+ start:878 stop:1042 length:165 start_codon:yes stop_codon:yes gene_type:complete